MNLLTPPALVVDGLRLAFDQALQEAVALGFTQIAVTARADRPPADLEALADSGLIVAVAALGEDLPAGCTLDTPDVDARRRALNIVRLQVIDAAQLGATCAWLRPGADVGPAAQACFAEACTLLADYAARRMLQLCVTHAPGRALPTAGHALAWVEQAGAAVGLLLDTGHLAPDEDLGALIRRAGPRLGGVIVPVAFPQASRASELAEALGAMTYRGVILCRPETP
jgi:sugar phosphate isomerase/epimerase